ncbi:DUF4197 domain-containing protein [Ponticaulis sp.]|uniref:DUF4197 domain-containing protein n=1 Tax=Ponticaulis sp. TaxID=2020902 RepID=UPI0025DE31A8|nr:DUF4197 domain-containing protein [Ponticaulis sp.]
MKYLMIAGLTICAAQSASAQSAQDIFNNIFGSRSNSSSEDTTTTTSNTSNTTGNIASALSSSEIDSGLRQALTIGAQAVGEQLSVRNGYFGDDAIRIPLPGRLGELQSQMSRFGLSGPLDELQESLNHAAEDAAPQAADLVVDAVQSITIQDAVQLLNGGDTAATDYLRGRTEGDLALLVEPYMRSALESSGAFSTLDSVTSRYGLSALSADLQEQLIASAVEEGLDGLFFYLAKEEQDIRNNPVERTTDLLRRVFGG